MTCIVPSGESEQPTASPAIYAKGGTNSDFLDTPKRVRNNSLREDPGSCERGYDNSN
jgi:hypothetical protein